MFSQAMFLLSLTENKRRTSGLRLTARNQRKPPLSPAIYHHTLPYKGSPIHFSRCRRFSSLEGRYLEF